MGAPCVLGPLVLCYNLIWGGRVFEHVAVVGQGVSSDHRRLPDAQKVFLQRLLGVQLLLLGRREEVRGSSHSLIHIYICFEDEGREAVLISVHRTQTDLCMLESI